MVGAGGREGRVETAKLVFLGAAIINFLTN